MKVAIAGAGKVGTYIADDLLKAGHQVLLIKKEPAVVERLRLELPAHTTYPTRADQRAARGRPRRRRRHGGRHGRGPGEPGGVAAREAEFAVPSASWPTSTTPRTSGSSTRPGASTCRCRPRTCSPPWSRKPCRSARWCSCCTSRAARHASSRSRSRSSARAAASRSPRLRSRATPPSWPWCTTATWRVPRRHHAREG